MCDAGDQGCHRDAFQFCEGRESPDGLVQSEQPEDDHTADGIEWRKVFPGLQIIEGNHGEAQIEPQQERQEISSGSRN